VRVPVGLDGSGALIESVRRLDDANVVVADVALHRPTLDDVFLSLTGHAAEDGAEPEPPVKRGRRNRRRASGEEVSA
jgi:ABC-2 type transport system ATP-binding protein